MFKLSELGTEALLFKTEPILSGSVLTAQALLWVSSINLIKASAEAIITAIIFLTVGLKPIPVLLSSIFLDKSKERDVSICDNLLLNCASIEFIVELKLFIPSNLNHCGITLS